MSKSKIGDLIAYCVSRGADIDFANQTQDQVNAVFKETVDAATKQIENYVATALQAQKQELLAALEDSKLPVVNGVEPNVNQVIDDCKAAINNLNPAGSE